MDDLINTQLGQYRLTEVIRRGGMSTVYKAYQESLDRYVAVKVLFHGQNPQFVARFQREARAIAHLQHPNILPIFDYGEQDGLLYLVLQYIEQGMTLGDLLGRPMEPVPALQLMGRVLAALDYAHERGIVHRDVKPANILMPTPSWPMLSDFGIVKLLTESDNQNLTAQGMIVGTPAYLAPEQVLGMHIDRRTDLYSAGIVLYEMVTGRVPFDTGTPIVVATKQAYEPPPPPLTVNPNLPKAVELVVLRALEKDPANRFQSAADMATALERVARQLDGVRAPQPVPSAPEDGAGEEDLDANYMAGIAAFEAGRWDQAVQRLRQVVAADPTYADAATMLEAAQEARAQQSGPPPPTAPPAPAAAPVVTAAPVSVPATPPPVAAAPPLPDSPAAAATAAPPPAATPAPRTGSTTTSRRKRTTTTPGEAAEMPTVPPAAPAPALDAAAPSASAAVPTPPSPAPAVAAGAAVAPGPATAPPATGSTTTSRRRTRTPAPAAEPATPAPGTPAYQTPAVGTPLAAAAAAPAAAVASAASAQAAPGDATSTPTSTTTRRRRAASATPPAVAPESPAPAPPAPPAATEATSTRPRTGTARRATKAAADTPTPLPMPTAPVPAAAPAAPPEAAMARAMPPAAAASAPQGRELEAGPMPVSAAGAAVVPPVPPPPAAPPREATGAPALQPATRRNLVPFIAVGAGVLLLILAAVFGPGLLGARTGGGGSSTPAATAPPTAASLPSATSGLPVGAVASATPAQVAGGEPTLAPTEPATTAPATAPPSPVPATAAPTAAMEMPTPAAIPPTTSQGAVGGLRFTDDGQHVVDQAVVTLTLDTLPAPPAGQGRVAWLVSSATGANLNLGRITPDAKGAATLTFTDTQGANLLAGYDGFVVTNEALEGTPFAPSSDVVLHGQLPVQAMVHISHLLVSYPDTPGQVGLEVGLRAQVNALVDHAQQLSGAQATGNLATVKQEAEAIANLIEGSKAPNYGDLNKDGQITDPGDGFGFLQNGTHDGYLLGVKDHAELSAAAPDATDTVKQHAEGVAITTDNVRDWVTQIRDKARAIIAAPNTTATRQLASDILDLATAVEQGRSIGTDGNIQPVKGSGGAITSYQEALHMADMPIQPAK